MNNETYYQRKQTFLNSDPDFVKLKDQRTKLNKKISAKKTAASHCVFGIAKIMKAADACMSFAMESENSGENDQETQDAILNRFTGECSECWSGTWHSAADHLMTVAVSSCKEVSLLDMEIGNLVKQRVELNDHIEAAEEVLVKTFNELEEKNKKEAKKNG